MTSSALLEFLQGEIDDGNAPFVRTLLAQAKGRILAGKGEIAPILQATLNGKTVQRAPQMNCVEFARICRQALAGADAAPATTLDFSGLSF